MIQDSSRCIGVSVFPLTIMETQPLYGNMEILRIGYYSELWQKKIEKYII